MMFAHQDLVHLLTAAFDARQGHLLGVLSVLLSFMHALEVLVLAIENGVCFDGIKGFKNILYLLELFGRGNGAGGWLDKNGIHEVGKDVSVKSIR